MIASTCIPIPVKTWNSSENSSRKSIFITKFQVNWNSAAGFNMKQSLKKYLSEKLIEIPPIACLFSPDSKRFEADAYCCPRCSWSAALQENKRFISVGRTWNQLAINAIYEFPFVSISNHVLQEQTFSSKYTTKLSTKELPHNISFLFALRLLLLLRYTSTDNEEKLYIFKFYKTQKCSSYYKLKWDKSATLKQFL